MKTKNKKRSTIASKKTTKHRYIRVSLEKMAAGIEALSHGRLIGPAQLALEINCTSVCARNIITNLAKRGCKLQTVELREGFRGPAVTGYALIENKASKSLLKQSFV